MTIKDEVFGTTSENLLVTLSDGETEVIVNPHANNTFILKDYASSDKNEDGVVETVLTLKVQNNSTTNTVKLFSMFPGNYNDPLTVDTNSKFENSDFINKDICIPLYVDAKSGLDKQTGEKLGFIPQVLNQWMYFRIKDAYNGNEYYTDDTYKDDVAIFMKDKLCGKYEDRKIKYDNILAPLKPYSFICGMCAFQHLTDIKDICITESDTSVNYKLLYPGESLEIPISVTYALNSVNIEVTKTMGFDLRNSLYSDPMNYKFEIKAKYSNNLANNLRKLKKVRYNPVVIN
jgi:hypothetical protein